MPIIIHGDQVEAPLQIGRERTHVFPGDSGKLTPFVSIYGGFGGLHVVRGAGLYLDEAENIMMPCDEINLSWRRGERKLRATMT